MFHQWFFSLDPDDKVIQNNISKALTGPMVPPGGFMNL
jgi:hypothetical protein